MKPLNEQTILLVAVTEFIALSGTTLTRSLWLGIKVDSISINPLESFVVTNFFVVIFYAIIALLTFPITYFYDSASNLSEERPKWSDDIHSVIAGFWISVNGALIFISGRPDRTPPHLQAIIPQILIPTLMVLRKIVFKNFNSFWKISGAFLILTGIILATMIWFGYALANEDNIEPGIYWTLLFILGQIPIACNLIQQEIYARKCYFVNGFHDYVYQYFRTVLYALVFSILILWGVNMFRREKSIISDLEYIICHLGDDDIKFYLIIGLVYTLTIIMHTLTVLAVTSYKQGTNYSLYVNVTSTMITFFVWLYIEERFTVHFLKDGLSLIALGVVIIGIYMHHVNKAREIPVILDQSISLCDPSSSPSYSSMNR